MKIVKNILIGLAALFLIITIISVFLPSYVMVSRTISINAPAEIIFEQVNRIQNWKKWSYWDMVDSNMISTYEGPESGVGNKHIWKSQHPEAGNGSMVITKSIPNQLVENALTFEGMSGESLGGWSIKDSSGTMYVTGYMGMEMGFFGRFFPGLFMDGFVGGSFEKSLANLKTLTEKLALEKPKTISFVVNKVQVTGMEAIGLKTTCKASEIGATLGTLFGELMTLGDIKELASAPIAIYHKWSPPDTVIVEAALAFKQTPKKLGNAKKFTTHNGNALKVDYFGNYNNSEAAHMAIDAYAKEKGKQIIGAPWEVYITDPMTEKDTAKWHTEIYYPIQ